jgi:hypothetical protein
VQRFHFIELLRETVRASARGADQRITAVAAIASAPS